MTKGKEDDNHRLQSVETPNRVCVSNFIHPFSSFGSESQATISSESNPFLVTLFLDKRSP